ncbi:5-bromo-4-chloroindolyl phosphate hydrolysis family protein [Pseudooctadecabacter sp.]|uniref:5-bromo-4-chloroindolyl phosphate hydrolysis family protein n=1 Tax=Pseudooctadecabacter sp. TaxID=1966338 RepID=UPI003F6D9EF9
MREEVIDQRRVDAAGAKANVLFLPGVLLAFLSLNEGAVGLAMGLVGAALLSLAAWLTRDGMRAQAAFDARKVARKPALPRKIIGAVLTGCGIALASLMNDGSTLAALLYGIVAGGLHITAFGLDPLRDKRMEGIDTFQQDRVARVVDEAEAHLASMRDHIASVKDRHLDNRVEQFQAAARRMIRTVEEDPRDLTGARKFLGVYLMGARDAAVKFADLYKRKRDEEARADFEALLTDLEQNFAARTEKMLLDDRSDMDIEIKVLRDRLQREGL